MHQRLQPCSLLPLFVVVVVVVWGVAVALLYSAQGDFKVDEQLVKACGKLQLLDRLLPRLKEQGHKVWAPCPSRTRSPSQMTCRATENKLLTRVPALALFCLLYFCGVLSGAPLFPNDKDAGHSAGGSCRGAGTGLAPAWVLMTCVD